MRIAEIVPVSCLSYIKDKNYHMCLAQLVLKNKEYADFYKKLAEEDKYVILDNGAAEKESLSFEELFRAYKIIQPREIILPDVLFNRQETAARSFLFFQDYMKSTNCKVMIVPQARTLREWISAVELMLKDIPADTVGVPKWLGMKNSFYRVTASGYLFEHDVEAHLLGCSENPEILKLCERINPKVRGCDSAYSYLCAKAGSNEITQNTGRPEETIDFLNDPKIETLPKLMRDLEEVVK